MSDPTPCRILITGSRTWAEYGIVAANLQWALDRRPNLLVVTGGCPTGADAIAEDWADRHDVSKEVHPALWDKHGRRAGFVRNAEMVNAGADLCWAFILNESQGATMCADLATKAGIPTRLIRRSAPEPLPAGWSKTPPRSR